MSSNVFFFGTYQSRNARNDPSKTSNINEAKWRSQYLVSPFSTLGRIEVNDQVLWVMLPSNTRVVFISDLEYQLRNDDLDNYGHIRYTSEAGIYDHYHGQNLEITAKYDPSVFESDDGANPNPEAFVNPEPFAKPLLENSFIKFAEVQLKLGYDYGVVGGPKFNTEIISTSDQREQRNSLFYLPLGRWQIGDRVVADSQLDKLEEVTYLKKFHSDRRGNFEGFRFKDWADYRGKNELIAFGDGVKTHFQLRKGYWAGNTVTYRPIQKPVAGTVEIKIDGVLSPDWEIDYINGVISHDAALFDGAELTASFEFDVPVWFENREIAFNLEAYYTDIKASVYRLQNVFVVEGRIPLSLPWVIEPVPEITQELNLGQIPGTIEKYSYSASKVTLKSGYIRREDKKEDGRLSFNLGKWKFTQAEVDSIFGYFYCARGKAREFPFLYQDNNYKIRFNQDNLNFKFEAANAEDALFSLSGLKLQLKEKELFQLPPAALLLEELIVDPKDSNNTAIKSSNPDSFAGSSTIKAFSLSAFSPISFDFIGAAPGVDPTRPYSPKAFWWAAGQLHLILQGSNSNTASNLGKNRLFYYQIKPGDWSLTYIDSEISNYILLQEDALIAKTSTGISVFGQAKYQPSGADSAQSGMLRFQVESDSTNLNFYPDSITLDNSFGLAKLLIGDRLFMSKTLPSLRNELIYSADNISYINNKYDANGGNPINQDLSEIRRSLTNSYLNREAVGNVWATDTVDADLHKVRYYPEPGIEEVLLAYNPENSKDKPFIWRWQNESGQLLVVVSRYYARSIQRTYFMDNKNWLLISEFEIPASTTEATRNLADALSFSSASSFGFDGLRNIIALNSNKTIYSKSGSGFATEITSVSGNNLSTNYAVTPYGFIWISYRYSSIFRSETKLYIVQTN